MKKYSLPALVFALYLLVLNPIPSVVMTSMDAGPKKFNFGDNLTIKLPASAKTVKNHFGNGSEVLLSYYFADDSYLFRGYIQQWQLDNLEQFLLQSKEASALEFTAHSLKPVSIAGLNGFVDEWTVSPGSLLYISGKDYWLKDAKSTQVLRISFATDAPSFSEIQLREIDNILNSVHWSP